MKTYTKEELAEILRKHNRWLANGVGGERADLSGADLHNANLRDADLRGADLSCADLYGADLHYADLRSANLRSADLHYADLRSADLRSADLHYADLRSAALRSADLRSANLRSADLHYADLRSADLYCADLYGADLHYADLRSADLRSADLRSANLRSADLHYADLYGAENLVSPIACPEKGSFIGYKKCRGDLIVELEICEDAKRSSATTRKCRCDKAKVIAITSPDGGAEEAAQSGYNPNFIYRVGDIVSVPDFDDNRWNECAPGIHFFITRQEAVDY